MTSAQRVVVIEVLRTLQETIAQDNKAKGWWDGVTLPLDARDTMSRLIAVEKLMLIDTETAEAMEEIRRGVALDHVYYEMGPTAVDKPCGFGVELADAVIRAFDLAAAANVNLGDLIMEKLDFNRTRPHRHGGKVS